MVSLESGDCERRGGKKYGDGIRVEVDGQDTVLVVVVEGGDRGFVVVRHCVVVLLDVVGWFEEMECVWIGCWNVW